MINTINVGYNFVALYMPKPCLGLHQRWLPIYKSIPPADDSVGKYSHLSIVKLISLTGCLFFTILFPVIAITSKQGEVQGLLCFLKGKMHLYERGRDSACHLVRLEIEFHLYYNTYNLWYYQSLALE